MRTAGPRATIGVELVPAKIDVEHLRERFWDPAEAAPPPPLEDVSEHRPARTSTWTPSATRADPPSPGSASSSSRPRPPASTSSVADVFGALPDDLRRPVELIGLIHLLLGARPDDPVGELPDAGALTAAIEREERVEAVRPTAPAASSPCPSCHCARTTPTPSPKESAR